MKRLLLLTALFLNSIYAYSEEYKIDQVKFVSHGDTLSGSIVFPKNGDVNSAVVFVHGSGKQTRNLHWAKRFASQGIAALVYDKRGVGLSGGDYESKQSVSEKNIRLLADDSIAALKVLSSHEQTKDLPLGLTGISQAGWIIPLAAEKSKDVDFMVLWSGPICKVSEEDIYSKYTADLDGKKVPTYEEALKSRKENYIWPDFLGADLDPSDSLATLKIPGIWVFGEGDGSVPVDLSIQRLKKQIDSGGQYEYALFSSLGHNNMSETFSMVTDWINTKIK